MHWKVNTKSGTNFKPGLALIGLSSTRAQPSCPARVCDCLRFVSRGYSEFLFFLPIVEVFLILTRTALPDSSLTLTLSNNLPQCRTFPDNLVPRALFSGSFSDTYIIDSKAEQPSSRNIHIQILQSQTASSLSFSSDLVRGVHERETRAADRLQSTPDWSPYTSLKNKLGEFDKRSKHFSFDVYFINSPNLFFSLCIVRRKLMLVSLGT